jgi:hypothetical protein
MTTIGGARPKTRRGGARPGAGALQVRFRLLRETALMLRVMTVARRGVTGNKGLSEDEYLDSLVRREYAEYEAGITREGE